jgi:DeoR/GlpR family transcriptional regulator of sugar metabolism
MIVAANVAVVVADSSKFGRVTPVRIGNFDSVRYVITERTPDKALKKTLAARGTELVVA